MSSTPTRWELARHRLREDALATLLLWAGFAVVVLGVTLIVALVRGDIRTSGWEIASQAPRWFAGAMGAYMTAVYLPLYIAHGYTRREFARQVPASTAVVVVLMAVLMALGYGLERGVYALGGWSQALGDSHLFPGPDAYGLIFVEFLLLFAVWATAGAMAGAAFYRGPARGLGVAPLALAMVAVIEVMVSPGAFEFVATTVLRALVGDVAGTSVPAAAGAAGAGVLLGAVVTWRLIRDLPIRSQRA